MARRCVVVCCFGCGALIGSGERNMVSMFWGDGDPGFDEVVEGCRETVVRMCRKCRLILVERAGFEVRLGRMVVELVLDDTADMSKTGAHGILRARVVRRVVHKWRV
jgi:hypothetical protein